MYRRILMFGVLSGALAIGCSDDDTGGSAGGGGMTGGDGGTGGGDGTDTGGGDASGGGDATGGAAGTQTCADYCAYVADLGCESEIEQDCVDGCNEARERCPSETEALYSCLLQQPLSDYVCDEFDEVTLESDACDEQRDAFFECIL